MSDVTSHWKHASAGIKTPPTCAFDDSHESHARACRLPQPQASANASFICPGPSLLTLLEAALQLD